MPVAKRRRILLVGATSRVGKLVLHHWRASLPACIEIVEQHRCPDRRWGFFWPLQEPPGDRLTALRVDAIICLAGVTPGPGADLSLNTPLAEAVLSAAKQAGVRRVLIASSSAVYGTGDGTPFSENDNTVPVNDYGAAKLAMERACEPWRESGLEVCCMRIGNVAGADALLLNLATAAAGQKLSIDRFLDGAGPVRSYIGPATFAEVLCGLAERPDPLPTTLNIATPSVVSMEGLAIAAGHPYTFSPAPEGAHQRITLNCHRLAARHTFAANASDPAQMVLQWKETLPR